MCCKNEFHNMAGRESNSCSCHTKSEFLSKKKKIESLKNYLSELEEKALDVKEYIKELETAK